MKITTAIGATFGALVIAFSAAAHAETYTIRVTAAAGEYYFDGERTPIVDLEEGSRYEFDLSSPSLRRHPFYLTLERDSGVPFSDGVTRGRSFVALDVTAKTPDVLFYSCTRHRGMGGDGFLAFADGMPPAPEPEVIAVTASRGKYFLNGDLTPVFDLLVGERYLFDVSSRTMGSHPLYLTVTPDSGVPFTEGVEITEDGNILLEVTEDTPEVLYYSCTRHRNMQGTGYLQVVDQGI